MICKTHKKGFTLTELLIVIGILAVLACIMIPLLSGIIDKSNRSSDVTNSSEMTNAIERFASEYTLYCNDISQGKLDTGNLDAAQGRVYNVTKATTQEHIEKLESEDGFNGVRINPNTKYPANEDTAKSIIKNYNKASSSVFEPKQSDNHYYYSPDIGIVVSQPTDKSSVEQLNALIQSGTDASGKPLDGDTEWIDLTDGSIPESGGSQNQGNNQGSTPTPSTPPQAPSCAHSNTEKRGVVESTCTTNGYSGDTYCVSCGEKVSTGISTGKKPHNYVTTGASQPTCTTDGNTGYGRCSCGATNGSGTAIVALGHDMQVVSSTAATCKVAGVTNYKCSRCNHTDSKTGDFGPHGEIEIQNKSNATCTTAGYTGDEVCNVCGETTKVGTEVSALGHEFQETNKIEPTCKTNGSVTNTCINCGYSENTVLDKLTTHTNTEIVNNGGGYSGDTVCKDCNTTISKGTYSANTLVFRSNGIAYFYGANNVIKNQFTGWMNTSYSSIASAPWKNIASSVQYVIIEDNVNPTDTRYWCQNFTSLKEAKLSKTMTYIGYGMFWNSNLEKVTIEENISRIETSAFYGCKNLNSIIYRATNVQDEVSYTTFRAAGRNGSGISVFISKNVQRIPDGLFYYGFGNPYESYGSEVTYLSPYVTNVVFENGSRCTYIGNKAFGGNSIKGSLTIPDSVTYIGEGAFRECKMSSLTIGKNVSTIGEDAFYDCYQLTNINYNATNVSDFVSFNGVFNRAGNSSSGIRVYIGSNVRRIPNYLFKPQNSTTTSPKIISVEFLPNSNCTYIGTASFAYLTKLSGTVNIPNSVTTIGNVAFQNCYELNAVNIGTSVSQIGGSVFSGCSSLASVSFADTTSWYYKTSSSQTGTGTLASVTNPTLNATNLTGSYSSYYWTKR